MKLIAASVLLLHCWLVQSERFSVVLDPAEKFNVSWSFENTESSSDVTFTVTCRTTGWVGIGLSPKGGMTGADIIVGWVDSNGKGHIKDMYATANSLPLLDESQDVKMISSSERNGITTVTFKRKINTCDEHDNSIQKSTTRLIYAYGSTDPVNNVLTTSDYHQPTKRGVRSIYLLEPQSHKEALPDDTSYFDMMVNNYHVPSDDTTYYCVFFTPPVLDRKHHIIAAEPLVVPGHEGLVHHMSVFGCWGVEKEHLRNNNKTEGICFTPEMPEFFDNCYTPLHIWAVGGTKFYFPENAGYPLGGNDGSAADYFMIEVHYNNPQRWDSFVDASGMRFTYTPTLRTEDVGNILIGNVVDFAVPPKPDRFKTVFFCHSSCTNEWIPESGVEVFGYMLHAHLLGVAIRIDWFRNGESMGVFANDNAYDFNFQENRLFPKNKRLLPGDDLKITCTYTDKTRETVTYGGFATSSEMCLAFLLYYPRQNVSQCGAFPGFTMNENDPVFSSLGLNASRHSNGFTNYKDILHTVSDWSEDKVQVFQEGYEVTDQFSRCNRIGGYPFESNYHPIKSSSFPSPHADDDKFCQKPNSANYNQMFPIVTLFATVSFACLCYNQ